MCLKCLMIQYLPSGPNASISCHTGSRLDPRSQPLAAWRVLHKLTTIKLQTCALHTLVHQFCPSLYHLTCGSWESTNYIWRKKGGREWGINQTGGRRLKTKPIYTRNYNRTALENGWPQLAVTEWSYRYTAKGKIIHKLYFRNFEVIRIIGNVWEI